MKSIIELVKIYKINKSDLIFNELIKKTRFLIFKYLKKVDEFYQEDLHQELLYGLFQVVNEFEFNNAKIERENQKMFLSFLDIKFKFIYIDFRRKNNRYHIANNAFFDKNRTFTNYSTLDLLEEYINDIKDLTFLMAFIEGNELLTEREVGKKLHISQQAVHKKKRQLYFKYRNQNSNKNESQEEEKGVKT